MISANILVSILLLWGKHNLIFIDLGMQRQNVKRINVDSQALGTGAKYQM